MSASSWRSSAIAAAERTAGALGISEDVQVEPFVANRGGAGEADRGSPVRLPAIVTREQGRRKKPGGTEIPYRLTVAFQRPVAIDLRDRVTLLLDGLSGPVVDLDKGGMDSGTGVPCALTAFIGFGA